MIRLAAIITASDRSARGERPDTSGQRLALAVREAGYECGEPIVIPDGADTVERAIREAVAGGARLVITTGGTGVSLRDRTPEGTRAVIEREIPGISEELRRRGLAATPMAMVSRGIAGIVGGTLVVNLPGSPAAVDEGVPIVLSVAAHVIDQIDGGDH